MSADGLVRVRPADEGLGLAPVATTPIIGNSRKEIISGIVGVDCLVVLFLAP